MIYSDDYEPEGEPLTPAEAWRVWSILTLCVVIDIALFVIGIAMRGY